jgi:hypothetical protein
LDDHSALQNRGLALLQVRGLNAMFIQKCDQRIEHFSFQRFIVKIPVDRLKVVAEFVAANGLPETRSSSIVTAFSRLVPVFLGRFSNTHANAGSVHPSPRRNQQ